MMNPSLLSDPAWFPDRLDPAHRLIRLVRTSHEILATSAFLDGRTPIASGEAAAVTLSLDRFVACMGEAESPLRWIFHHSFCGSTLLARAATIERTALCLREPQVLVDLTNWRLTLGAGEHALYAATLRAVRAKLAQQWAASEAIVVKPSNWVNPVIADLWRPAAGDGAVIATIAPRPFLVAVLRGGRDRIVYTLGVHERLTSAWPALQAVIADAARPEGDPIAAAMVLVAAMHWAQDCVLKARSRIAGPGRAHDLTFPDFLRDPAGTGAQLARALGLPAAALVAGLDRARLSHAKDPALPIANEAVRNDAVIRHHDRPIATALAAYDRLRPHSETAIAAIAATMRADDGTHPVGGCGAAL